MTDSADTSSRLDKAKEIVNNPSDYMVCEGCDSIVVSNTIICPNCHGYRFDSGESRVVDQAVWLGTREQTSVTSQDLYS